MTIRPSSVSVDPPERLRLAAVDVPGDFSSAAPFIVAATLIPESRITIHDVSLNPRRTGLLDVLERMGARVGILQRRRIGAEQVGDLEVRAAELTATTIRLATRCRGWSTSCRSSRCSPRMAHGESWVYGAGELRAKESRPDRGRRRGSARGRRPHRGARRRLFGHGRADAAEGREGRRARRPPHRDARRGRGPGEPDGVEVQGADSVSGFSSSCPPAVFERLDCEH